MIFDVLLGNWRNWYCLVLVCHSQNTKLLMSLLFFATALLARHRTNESHHLPSSQVHLRRERVSVRGLCSGISWL